MTWDRYEFTILQVFLPALINDDESGLDDSEADDFRVWRAAKVAALPAACDASHWAVDVADCTHFARCEITGLMGDAADVALEFRIPLE